MVSPLIRGLRAGVSSCANLITLIMAKQKKKSPEEASKTFHDIMKASVKDNPKPKREKTTITKEGQERIGKLLTASDENGFKLGANVLRGLNDEDIKEIEKSANTNNPKIKVTIKRKNAPKK
jgi:hypothetical protein